MIHSTTGSQDLGEKKSIEPTSIPCAIWWWLEIHRGHTYTFWCWLLLFHFFFKLVISLFHSTDWSHIY